MKLADWQTFIVAMTVLIGGGFMLMSPNAGADIKVAVGGFIGAVVSYFFSRQTANASVAATIAAQNGAPKPGA